MDTSSEPLLSSTVSSRHGHRRYTSNEYTSIQRNVESESNLDYVAVGCILVTVLCERLAYYSVIINMIPFCTSLNMTPTMATTVSQSFSGLLMLLASAVDYVAWFQTGPVNVEVRTVLFVIALVLIVLGSGGIRSNNGPLGAQKVEGRGSQAVQTFFNWFYWFVSLATFIAFTGVAYVQQELGFTWAFLIPIVVMIIGQIVFSVGKCRLSSTPVEGSPICDIIGVCWVGAFKCRSNQPLIKYSKETVDRVRSFTKLLPVCGLFIVYWAVYAQCTSTFLLQSERMDIGIESKQVPVGILSSVYAFVIMLLIPTMELLVYPYLKRRNLELSLLQRIAIGMVLAICSVLAAGVLEFCRKDHMALNKTIEHNNNNASTISVFYQIPQFAFLGGSEVFASISGMEFAYSQAPNTMKGFCMGMFLETAGIGYYVSLTIITIVRQITGRKSGSWFPEEINDGQTEYLFFLLAILMFLNFCLFLFVAYCYKYRSETEEACVEHEIRNCIES